LPCNVSSVILAATFVFLVTREKRNHSAQCGLTNLLAIGQARGSSHATANALLSGFARSQATFAMLSAQLKAAPCSIAHSLRRGEAFSVAPQPFFLRLRSDAR
jgi:hypothetical protein